jgi:hypothetical protein
MGESRGRVSDTDYGMHLQRRKYVQFHYDYHRKRYSVTIYGLFRTKAIVIENNG